MRWLLISSRLKLNPTDFNMIWTDSEIQWTYMYKLENSTETRFHWACSWPILENATSLTPASTGFSGILLSEVWTQYSQSTGKCKNNNYIDVQGDVLRPTYGHNDSCCWLPLKQCRNFCRVLTYISSQCWYWIDTCNAKTSMESRQIWNLYLSRPRWIVLICQFNWA